MARNVKLLLTENVDTLGIVGDVVNVRTGYARNFLLPRNLATTPSEAKIKELAAKRAEAERQLALLRKQREELTGKLAGVEVTLTKSCNDQGILYGAITQQEVATALVEKGFAVKPRDVRMGQVIKRVDTYDVHIKLDSDLDAVIKLWVVADRKLDLEKAGKDEEAAEKAPAQAEGAATEGGEKAAGQAGEKTGEDRGERRRDREGGREGGRDGGRDGGREGRRDRDRGPRKDIVSMALEQDQTGRVVGKFAPRSGGGSGGAVTESAPAASAPAAEKKADKAGGEKPAKKGKKAE
ncbi:MAG: 50S ribosomal protein L9 [Planctomycetota bacterium]|nr:50S ribosomal protein L9 [Planctomycetota bacterium]